MAISVTSRAICAPRQKCLPEPKPRCPSGRRVDVEGVRIGKFALVAVGRAEGERDFVAGADGLAVQRHVARGGALEALRRRIEAQRFLDRRRDQRRIGNEPPPRVGIVVQIEREHAHEA